MHCHSVTGSLHMQYALHLLHRIGVEKCSILTHPWWSIGEEVPENDVIIITMVRPGSA